MKLALLFIGFLLASPFISSIFAFRNKDMQGAKAQVSKPISVVANVIIVISFLSMWAWGSMHYAWWVVALTCLAGTFFSMVFGDIIQSMPGGGILAFIAIPSIAIAEWLTDTHHNILSAKTISWVLGFGHMGLVAAINQYEVFVTRGRRINGVRWTYHLCFYGTIIASVIAYGWYAIIIVVPAMIIGSILFGWIVGAIWMYVRVCTNARSSHL